MGDSYQSLIRCRIGHQNSTVRTSCKTSNVTHRSYLFRNWSPFLLLLCLLANVILDARSLCDDKAKDSVSLDANCQHKFSYDTQYHHRARPTIQVDLHSPHERQISLPSPSPLSLKPRAGQFRYHYQSVQYPRLLDVKEKIEAKDYKKCLNCITMPAMNVSYPRKPNSYLSSIKRQSQVAKTTAQLSKSARLQQKPTKTRQRYESPTSPLEPQSDEKCPMTDSLTVCDQISSYPADVILYKVGLVQKALKQSGLNLNSFFYDERDYLSEPDIGVSPYNSRYKTDQRVKSVEKTRNSTHRFNGANANIDSRLVTGGRINHDIGGNVPSAKVKPFKRPNGNKFTSGDHVERLPHPHEQSPPSVGDTNEFVKLVENQAISIFGQVSIDDRDRYPTNKIQTEGGQVSIASSNRTTIHIGRAQNQYRPNSNVAARIYQPFNVGENLLQTGSKPWPIEESLVFRTRLRSRRQVSDGVLTDSEPQIDSERADGVAEPADERRNQVEQLCRAKSIYITPKAAINDRKQWKYVVNAPEQDSKIIQIIRVEVCLDPSGACSDQVSLPFGFTSQCKQKYSKKKLLAVDAKSGLLELDSFFIPSCCVCELVRNFEPFDGSGETFSDTNAGLRDAPTEGLT